MGDVQNCVGKFVFVERTREYEKGKTIVDSGEYFVLRQTPGTLYVVTALASSSYNLRHTHSLPLKGQNAYTVIDVSDSRASLKQWVEAVDEDALMSDGWGKTCGGEAVATLRKLRKFLEVPEEGAGNSETPNKTPTLVGKYVIVERAEASDKDSAYYNGEYVVLRQTPNSLYCIKPIGGYAGHNEHRFALRGTDRYDVVDVQDNPEDLKLLIKDFECFAKEKSKPNKGWIDSVYDDAARHARRLQKVLDEREALANDGPDGPKCGEFRCPKLAKGDGVTVVVGEYVVNVQRRSAA